MAFYDDLARDPKSEEEFWAIIEETYVQVEGALTAYPTETREEALAGTLRGGNFRDTAVSFIRYRGVDKLGRARSRCRNTQRQALEIVRRRQTAPANPAHAAGTRRSSCARALRR
jgi:hypothetical protein